MDDSEEYDFEELESIDAQNKKDSSEGLHDFKELVIVMPFKYIQENFMHWLPRKS